MKKQEFLNIARKTHGIGKKTIKRLKENMR